MEELAEVNELQTEEPIAKEVEQEAPAEQEPEEVVVTIGEESPPTEDAPAPEWVRELRKNHRELQRKYKELEEQTKAKEAPAVQLGKKPTLEDCEYDADRLEQELDNWYETKRKVEDQKAQDESRQQEEAKAWNGKVEAFNTAKAALRVADYGEAEATMDELLPIERKAAIISYAKKPELVVYALGKNPAKAKELASITDPAKYIYALAELEMQLKVAPRKAPPPERTVSGDTGISGSVDSTLEKLRQEAEKTGDMSKVLAYKRDLKSKSR